MLIPHGTGESPALPTPARSTIAIVTSLILCAAVLTFSLSLALLNRIDVPFVDGWPVLHRIMLKETEGLGWGRYLFGLHGAHLHAVIYLLALLDHRWFGGQQELQTAVSFLAIVAHALLVVVLLIREGLGRGRSMAEIVLATVAATALISSLSDTETLLIPFQAVLTVSRIFYIGLLWALCLALIRGNLALYVAAMIVAVPVVTFHGTGHLFAVCVIILHLLLRQRPARLLVSCLPLIFAILVQSRYSAGGGELANIGQVLNLSAIREVPLAFITYFSTPFVAYLHIVDNRWLLLPGAILAASTILLTLLGLRASLGLTSWSPAGWWRQYRSPAPGTAALEPAVVFFTIIGILLLMSATAAAIFWFIRSAPARLAAWPLIFDATRYGAYSTLACIMPMAAWLHRTTPRRGRDPARPVALVTAGVFFVAGLGATIRMNALGTLADRVNFATAGISVGLPPILPLTTDGVWPQVGQDWFWKTELPRTIDWLRRTQTGPWRDLPPLHSRGGPTFAAYQLGDVMWQPFPSDAAPGWCTVTAKVIGWGRNLPGRSTITPMSRADGVVQGYLVLTHAGSMQGNRPLVGVAGCSLEGEQLFIPAGNAH